jgi:hypothetical protein
MRSTTARRLFAGIAASAVAAAATFTLVVGPITDDAGNSLRTGNSLRVKTVGNSLGNSL